MSTCRSHRLPCVIALLPLAVVQAMALPTTPTPVLAQSAATTRVSAQSSAQAPEQPAVAPDVASYDIGLVLGSQLTQNGLGASLSRDALIRGLKDALGGKRVKADEREAAQRFSRSAHDTLAKRNEALAHDFLSKNTHSQGVTTLPSGLQYRVLAAGDPKGPLPGPMDQVNVRYRASLIDGTLLDSSEDHPQAAVFRMNSMIAGWHEALAAMHAGAKWQVFVPPNLAYGENSPPPIPPGALIVYELELLRVDATPPQMPPQFMKPRPDRPPVTP